MARKKCKNSIRLTECLRLRYFSWKCLAIESKLVEIFENTKKVQWDDEKMDAIACAVSPYVFQLEINQLLAIDDMYLEKNRYNPLYKIFNYPPKDCHHGNFGSAVGQLANLVSLKLRFGIAKIEFQYHERYFEMSYDDIDSLSK